MARANGVEDLLPYTIKGTKERLTRRLEQGLRVKGTGVGQKVKGKLWERTQKGRLEKRRQAMLGMPKLVQRWKQVCFAFHGVCVCGGVGRGLMVCVVDGSWTGVEEVAEVAVSIFDCDILLVNGDVRWRTGWV